MLKTILKKLSHSIKLFFGFLFGQFSWTTPPWINYLKQKIFSTPKQFFITTTTLIISLAAILFGYHWYQSLPKPEQVIAKITVPKISTIENDVIIPDSLIINFGVLSHQEFQSRSVSPINLIGQEIKKGITISPVINGNWKWDSDSRLIFKPATDWPAGQSYDIQFSKNFFTTHTNMESLKENFSTLPFKITINEIKFYQDPLNPSLRQITATLNFNYPVDADSLEKNTSLIWQTLKNQSDSTQFKYTYTYDKTKRVAYFKSQPFALPSVERYIELKLSKGIKPLNGYKTKKDISSTLLIPDANSYFKITQVNNSIIRNPQDRPEQILTIETSLGVTEAELNNALHVYVLPKDYPATAIQNAKKNYAWQDTGDITPAILALSTPLNFQAMPSDRDYATLHSYKFNIQTPAYLYIKIDKGVKGFGDFALASSYDNILTAPIYPQEISFLHKGALLALGTEEKLSVLVRGLDAVKFKISRVLPQNINHLITQTGGDFSNPYFLDLNFNQDNISDINSQILSFDASDASKEQYTALNLQQYFNDGIKNATDNIQNTTVVPRLDRGIQNNSNHLGLFLLQANGWNKEKNFPLEVQANRLILITDLGLIVKDNIDTTHDVYVQSISNGNPVKNAAVAILGKNGIPLLTRTTDAMGHVSFPSLKDFNFEKEPTVYVVTQGNDVSFIPYNRYDRQLNFSRFDIGGVTHFFENQTALTAYIFTERGIYRPGDMVHAGIIVKQPYLQSQPAGLPLQAMVIDPRGVTVKDIKTTLNADGFFTLYFQPQTTSPTGQYQIYLYIVKDNHASSLIGSATVNVSEFLPDRMRISSYFSPTPSLGWTSPIGLTAKINLENLYGAPAANHKISGKILLTPKAINFKQYPNYIFVDPLLNPKLPPKVFTETLTDTHTNEQGQAELNLKLDRFDKATYQLSVFVEGFEAEGGRSVTTQIKTLVSPLAYFVGYKTDGDLHFIKQNSQRQINFIAINPALKQQSLNDLTLQLFSEKPVSTLVKKDDGTYQYQSIMQTTQISSNAFSISEQGSQYNLLTNTIGDFLIKIIDKNNNELSRFKFSVVGASQQSLPQNAELNVKLNKTEFKPGEDIEMQITAPYVGAGLITIERDKVYASQWFKTNTTSSLQKIHIPNDFQGNGYVNIAFVRDLNSDQIFMSPLSYSVLPFNVTHENHVIHVDLSTPELARPGDNFTMTYKTDKPSKIILFAVDQGILQVTQYQPPNPLEFFFAKHALEVSTSQIVDQILPKFIGTRELSAIGGDAGNAALLKNLNPFKRVTEAPVVYWSGITDADVTPKQLTYHIPDYFNGMLTVMAVAVANDAAGFASRSTNVRGYFVINPNVPTFAAPNDEFDVTASIANNVENSGKDARVKVTLQSNSFIKIINDVSQTINIPEGQEKTVTFKVRATENLGSGKITFTAALNDKTSQSVSTLSVRPLMPYATNINSGYTTDTKKSLTLDKQFYPEYRNVEAITSYNPFILLTGIQNYLTAYPYGCIEQLVSKAFPWLAMLNQSGLTVDTQAIQNKINQTIQLISQRQMSSGGFNYWPEVGTTESNDFASVYAMHFLTEAKAQGFSATIPNDVFSAGIQFLRNLVTQTATSLEQARIQAYAIYILTRNEIITSNYLTHLQLTLDQHPEYHWHDDIISAYIASTYQLLKNTNDAEKIINYFQPKFDNKNTYENDFYNNNIANAQYLYLNAKHFPQRLSQLNKVLMSLVTALNNDSISTILSGYTSLALSAYHANDNSLSAPLITTTTFDGKEQTLSHYQNEISENVKTVNFNNANKQLLFYQLTQAGFDKQLPQKIINQGIEVYREFRDANNKVVDTINLGDEITVNIRARSTDNQSHSNVALVDLLPGGFDVVRESVQPTNMDYVDAREDRVIFFGNISPDAKEIIYKIKAVSTGIFSVPPIFAEAMYNPMIKSVGVVNTKMKVK